MWSWSCPQPSNVGVFQDSFEIFWSYSHTEELCLLFVLLMSFHTYGSQIELSQLSTSSDFAHRAGSRAWLPTTPATPFSESWHLFSLLKPKPSVIFLTAMPPSAYFRSEPISKKTLCCFCHGLLCLKRSPYFSCLECRPWKPLSFHKDWNRM
jgi:hypothetical protein